MTEDQKQFQVVLLQALNAYIKKAVVRWLNENADKSLEQRKAVLNFGSSTEYDIDEQIKQL